MPVDPAFFETCCPHEIGQSRAVVAFLIEDRRCLANDFLSRLLAFAHVPNLVIQYCATDWSLNASYQTFDETVRSQSCLEGMIWMGSTATSGLALSSLPGVERSTPGPSASPQRLQPLWSCSMLARMLRPAHRHKAEAIG